MEGSLFTLGDLLAQGLEDKDQHEWKRTLRMGIYGTFVAVT
jgi:hypothetical protein